MAVARGTACGYDDSRREQQFGLCYSIATLYNSVQEIYGIIYHFGPKVLANM